MEWVTPITGLLAAAISIPLLLALYFLKLKRLAQPVSSTLLWKRAVQDLQVNAPFQWLRRNLLLLLQLLALAMILMALAGPVLSMVSGAGQRYVLLIDRSASMSAADVEPSRLAEAQRRARRFVESLRTRATFGLRETGDQAMIVAFDERAKVMCNFTSDKRQLAAAIDAIEPGHGRSRLSQALTVANAFAQSAGEEGGGRRTPARLVLYSDGRLADVDGLAIAPDDVVYERIGQSRQNVAVTALQARRSYESPDRVTVFATVANYDTQAVDVDVQLSFDGDVLSVRSLTLPTAQPDPEGGPDRPGQAAVEFTLTQAGGGIIELRQLHDDVLTADDAAWVVLQPPRRSRALLVTRGNVVLESVLRACPLAGLEVIGPDAFDAMDPAAFEAQGAYDVIVLDNHVPAILPRSRYLVFGRPPKGIDVVVPQQIENQMIVDWRPQHALTKHVNLANLYAAKGWRMILPRDADVLAEFNTAPAIALLQRQGSTFVLLGFDVFDTNWPFEPSFVLFVYNAVTYLGLEATGFEDTMLTTGEPLVLEGVEPGMTVRVSGPGIETQPVQIGPGPVARFVGTDRVGVYTLTVAGQASRAYAVNLLDDLESDVQPAENLVLGASRVVAAQEDRAHRANLALWPWLVLGAMVLVCTEWVVYNSKVRL
ncbi:MAG TPA: VWA domain-containing protein [Phycisphaerales bacterium]|nr:VWA domain-containing protein [Phycisphaerales bacterium]